MDIKKIHEAFQLACTKAFTDNMVIEYSDNKNNSFIIIYEGDNEDELFHLIEKEVSKFAENFPSEAHIKVSKGTQYWTFYWPKLVE